MQDGNSQIRVATDGNVACQWRAWGQQGKAWLTVIVKATFTMTPGAAVVPTSPLDVVLDDRTFGKNPTRSVEAAAEGAPFLAKCDVLLTGHAYGGGRGAAAVRLAVYRDRVALVDRTAHVFGERDAAGAPRPFDRVPLVHERAWGGPGVDANPVGSDRPSLVDPNDPRKPVCFAPVSRFWPARKRLLGQLDVARSFGAPGPIYPVPDALSWAYFQAAPAEQQTEHLRGDEWIVLDGVSASLPRLQTQLMGARAAARVASPGGEAEVPLVADMLVLDADRLTCSVVWRGRVELGAAASDLSRVAVAAGLDMPGRPIGWDRIWSRVAGAPQGRVPGGLPRPQGEPAAGEATLGIGEEGQRAASLRAVAPFSIPGSRAAEGPRVSSATPWAGREQATTASVSRGEPAVPAAFEVTLGAATGHALEATITASAGPVGESTLGLSDAEQAAQSTRQVAPFSVRASGSQGSASLVATPWSGETRTPLPVATVGEATLDLPSSRATPPAPSVVAAAPPAYLFVPSPATPPVPPSAPATMPVVSSPVASSPVVSSPVVSSPVAVAPAPTAPLATAPLAAEPAKAPFPGASPAEARRPAIAPAQTPAREPPSLSERLLAAGAGGDDVAALMRALNPPPPPPLPDED